jgi:hypothetical protein
MKKQTFTVKLAKVRRRTPIKPVQTHKSDVEYSRKIKHKKETDGFR